MPEDMPTDTDRARLVYAAHRFAKIAGNSPVKLFALLYMLDIRYFREAGRSCTGETYYAMADGPAPATLRPLLAMRGLPLEQGVCLLTASEGTGFWPAYPHPYCARGLAILRDLESACADKGSRDLSLDDANAWWRVYNGSRGVGAVIPYEWTLPCAEPDSDARPRLPGWRPPGGAGLVNLVAR